MNAENRQLSLVLTSRNSANNELVGKTSPGAIDASNAYHRGSVSCPGLSCESTRKPGNSR